MEYDLYLFHSGDARLDIDGLPTKPVAANGGVRLAVALDGQEPRILEGRGGDVLANLRRLTATLNIASAGRHTLTVWMVDPGVVIDKIVLAFAPPTDAYLGPPESFRR